MPIPLIRAAWNYVMDSDIPARLIEQGLLGSDPMDGHHGFENGWVFSGGDENGDPFRNVAGTGLCAVVLYSADEWAPPANFRSTQYPRLHLVVFADPTRDASGQPIARDAEDKAYTIWRALHPLFHDSANVIHQFGDLAVISTVQGGTWTMMDVPNGDGAVRGDCTYNLQID